MAVVGIGNELNGDDGAGVWVAKKLFDSVKSDPRFTEQVLILNAGLAPENFTGVLRRFRPDAVLFVDAAEMGAAAGAVQLIDWRDVNGFGPSTHLQPISTLGEFLVAELDCQVYLLGIQPGRLDLDERLTPEVRRSVAAVVHALRQVYPMNG